MKKYSVLIICLICLALSGCREYGEKRIVKLITIDANNISLHYYDHSAAKPAYLVEKGENKGIENTLTELLSQNEYDLKLCKYAVCDSNTVLYKAGELYDALIKTKFSPDIIIIQGDTTTESEKVVNISGKNYPIYNYYAENGRITGIIENLEDTQKNIIIHFLAVLVIFQAAELDKGTNIIPIFLVFFFFCPAHTGQLISHFLGNVLGNLLYKTVILQRTSGHIQRQIRTVDHTL